MEDRIECRDEGLILERVSKTVVEGVVKNENVCIPWSRSNLSLEKNTKLALSLEGIH